MCVLGTEPNSSPLEGRQVFLTTAPSLQPQRPFLFLFSSNTSSSLLHRQWLAQLSHLVYIYQKHRKSPWSSGLERVAVKPSAVHQRPFAPSAHDNRQLGPSFSNSVIRVGCTLVARNQSLWEYLYDRNWQLLQTRILHSLRKRRRLLSTNGHITGHHNHLVTIGGTEVWAVLWLDYDLLSLKCNTHCEVLTVG